MRGVGRMEYNMGKTDKASFLKENLIKFSTGTL